MYVVISWREMELSFRTGRLQKGRPFPVPPGGVYGIPHVYDHPYFRFVHCPDEGGVDAVGRTHVAVAYYGEPECVCACEDREEDEPEGRRSEADRSVGSVRMSVGSWR